MLKREEITCKTCELSCEAYDYIIDNVGKYKRDGAVECRLNSEPCFKLEVYWCAEGRWRSPRGLGYLISYIDYLNLLAEEESDDFYLEV